MIYVYFDLNKIQIMNDKRDMIYENYLFECKKNK